jgi:hypothetical protein
MSPPTTAEDCPACAARGELTFDADTGSAPLKGSPLSFEFHQGARVACPDCGRLYLRTLTNGDVPVDAPEPVVEVPKPAPDALAKASAPPGCARCVDENAAAAWNAINAPSTLTFVQEPHFSVHATRCSCGQPFVVVFTERVDFRDGSDTQIELAVAVWPGELERLSGEFRTLTLTTLVRGRAFLVKSSGDAPRWVASGFSIGPHH